MRASRATGACHAAARILPRRLAPAGCKTSQNVRQDDGMADVSKYCRSGSSMPRYAVAPFVSEVYTSQSCATEGARTT